MPIVITDDDATPALDSGSDRGDAGRVPRPVHRRAVNPPRLRYSSDTPDPTRRYVANIHAGAVASYQVACVRAGSNFMLMDERDAQRRTLADPDAPNWSIIILYDLASGEPLAFMHESYLSGLRVGATSALAVAEAARADAAVLGLFGTGKQAFPNCRAICAVRPIRRVKVYSPNPAHRRGVRRAHGGREGRGGRASTIRARSCVAPISSAAPPIRSCRCSTASGSRAARWSSPSPIRTCSTPAARSTRRPSRVRATSSSTTGTASSPTGRSSCSEPIEKGLVQRENVHDAGRRRRRQGQAPSRSRRDRLLQEQYRARDAVRRLRRDHP